VRAPLAGRTILVTRPREEAGDLLRRLRDLGADAIAAPAIRLGAGDSAPLAAAQREAVGGAFAWIVFTSASGVRAWFQLAQALGGDARPRARFAVVGTGTAEALREGGLEPDLIPPTFTTAALAEAFPEGSGRVLLPRADLATGELERSLVAKGWTPYRVDAYRIELAEGLPEPVVVALAEGRVDAVTFTSESTVTGFAGATAARPAAVCIGPVTAEAARREGFQVGGIAQPHTVDGLIDAVVGLLGTSGGG
jgi:uroporphyrinogen-III synthase